MVSVIVPTRNSARTLEVCLASVRSQTFRQVELIVVDNRSSDRTQEIARPYADVVETWGPERSAQRNRGASLAHSKYLLFVDSDMRLSPSVIDECVRLLESSAAPAVIIPEVSIGQGYLARCRALERSCYVGDDLVEAARFFRAALFHECGGFDEELIGGDDWDLTQRLAPSIRLPRTQSTVFHDEGRLQLHAVFRKKRYYAGTLVRYWRKHPKIAARQANVIFRPAFLRSWRRLVAHPVLALGVFLLKSLEAVAVVLGTSEGMARGRDAAALRKSPH